MKYIQAHQKEMKKELTETRGSSSLRSENNDRNAKSYVGYAQLFPEKRATGLKKGR